MSIKGNGRVSLNWAENISPVLVDNETSVTDKLAHFAIKYVKMTVSGFLMIACGQTEGFKIG